MVGDFVSARASRGASIEQVAQFDVRVPIEFLRLAVNQLAERRAAFFFAHHEVLHEVAAAAERLQADDHLAAHGEGAHVVFEQRADAEVHTGSQPRPVVDRLVGTRRREHDVGVRKRLLGRIDGNHIDADSLAHRARETFAVGRCRAVYAYALQLHDGSGAFERGFGLRAAAEHPGILRIRAREQLHAERGGAADAHFLDVRVGQHAEHFAGLERQQYDHAHELPAGRQRQLHAAQHAGDFGLGVEVRRDAHRHHAARRVAAGHRFQAVNDVAGRLRRGDRRRRIDGIGIVRQRIYARSGCSLDVGRVAVERHAGVDAQRIDRAAGAKLAECLLHRLDVLRCAHGGGDFTIVEQERHCFGEARGERSETAKHHIDHCSPVSNRMRQYAMLYSIHPVAG